MESSNQNQVDKSMPAAWQHNKVLGDCMIELYENKLWTDVKFRCSNHEEHERIHAHKIILAARSPVFQAMFFGPCAETKQDIVLDNIEAETFDSFLKFIYQDKVTLTEDIAASVLETAHYYHVTNLVLYCADFLGSCITSGNVCDILSLARRHDVISLRKTCCNFIDKNAAEVMKSDGFLKVTEDTLTYIIKGDTFFADEVVIFKKAEEWAQKKIDESNLDQQGQTIRKVLGSSFFHMRLPTMTSLNLLKCTRRKGYFSAEEYEDIVDFINRTPDTTLKSNSCIQRVSTKELVYCTDVGWPKKYVLKDEINTTFQVSVTRDVKFRKIELAEIYPYLKYDETLYDKNGSKTVQYRGNSLSTFSIEFQNKVIHCTSSFNNLSILKEQHGEDLPDYAHIDISGELKVTCRKINKEIAGENEEDGAIEKCENVGSSDDGRSVDGRSVVDDDVDNDVDDSNEMDLINEQEIEMTSMDKTQRIINLDEPLLLEVSRSPYTFTLNLDYKNVCSDKLKMKTLQSSTNILTNNTGYFQVKGIKGNFSGIQSICFEHISNRD